MEKRIIGYIRVSSKKQQDDGLSIENQNRRLLEAGCDLILVDVGSGGKANREKYQQIISMVKAGEVAEVKAIRLDRIGRSTIEILKFYQILQTHKVKLIILDMGIDFSSPAGEVFLSNLATFAQFERRLISEKLKSAHEYKRQLNQPAHAPFGYRFEKGELKPDDRLYKETGLTRWAVAGDVVTTFLKKMSARGTLKALADKYGIDDGRKRSDFPKSSIGLLDWLRLPTLRGFVHNPVINRVVKGSHEPLINEQEYRDILGIIRRNGAGKGYYSKSNKHPLSGLVRCVCGAICSISIGGNKKYPKIYYVCNDYRRSKCKLRERENVTTRYRYIDYDDVEVAVVNAIRQRSVEVAEAAEAMAAEKSEPSQELAELDRQIVQLEAMVVAGGIGGEIASDALERMRIERQNLVNEPMKREKDDVAVRDMIATLNDNDFWADLTKDEKITLYHWAVKRVAVRESQIIEISLSF